jgi:hypothetical protein
MVAKFLARLLGLWTPQQLPEAFHGRVENVDYDVQPLSRGMVSISIHLPRDRMRIQPRLFRKIEDPCLGGGWIYPQLFNMGAQSVDVGFSGDKIEAIFPGEIVRVDKAFAEQVVALMVRLRKEATGQEVVHVVEQRPWAKEAENAVDVDGEIVTFEFSSCLADTDAEAGTLGNLDVMVRTTPGLPPDKLADNLRLEVPGQDELLSAPAHGPFEGGIELSFGLVDLASSLGLNADRAREWMQETAGTLQEVNVFWGNSRETKLATVRCVRAPENA